ncbi:MAG TPA: pitrilysin family protein [Alphaproteobacteria bacterium]
MTVEVTQLSNGLRVVTHRMDSVETVSLGVWVNVGTRHEAPEVNGVAHLLEHMAFKGTKRRSARAIAEEIEAVGGSLNAHTTREFTAYHATVLKADVAVAVDIIADILQHSVFDEAELDRERVVIAQEIGEAQDTPDDVVYDNFQEAAFPGQPIGRPILGSAEIIRAIKRGQILDYMGRHYAAPRMVVAAAGNLDHRAFARLAEAAFGELSVASVNGFDAAVYRGGEFREERDLEQVHLVVGFEGLPNAHPDFFALSVASTLLGGGMSSRLFQEIRENRGLVYSIYSFAAPYTDTGIFCIYAGTGESQLAELVPLLCDEVRKTADGVGDAELGRAKAQLKAGTLMTLESTSARCEQLARQLHVYGRPLSVPEMVARIDAVDRDAVERALRRTLATKPTVAAVGPLDGLESYDSIARRLG